MKPTLSSPAADPVLPLKDRHMSLQRRSNFYIILSIFSLLLVLGGFSVTYWIPLSTGSLVSRPLVHVHATLYVLWILLFILQPILIRNRKVNLHRKIGTAGFILAGFMLLVGYFVAISAARLESPALAVNGLSPKAFMLIPLTDMALFGGFIGLSLTNLKRLEFHKRYMVLATSSILPAAVGRLIGILGIATVPVFLLSQEILVIVAVLYEWRSRGRVHPVYIWGGLAMFAIHVARMPVAGSEWWATIAEWLTN